VRDRKWAGEASKTGQIKRFPGEKKGGNSQGTRLKGTMGVPQQKKNRESDGLYQKEPQKRVRRKREKKENSPQLGGNGGPLSGDVGARKRMLVAHRGIKTKKDE